MTTSPDLCTRTDQKDSFLETQEKEKENITSETEDEVSDAEILPAESFINSVNTIEGLFRGLIRKENHKLEILNTQLNMIASKMSPDQEEFFDCFQNGQNLFPLSEDKDFFIQLKQCYSQFKTIKDDIEQITDGVFAVRTLSKMKFFQRGVPLRYEPY